MIQIPMDPMRWKFDSYSHGVGRHPMADGGGWMFNFPSTDGVHYLTSAKGDGKWDFSALSAVTVTGAIDQIGDVVPGFIAAEGGEPSMRLLIERGIDINRYWSNPQRLVLAPGQFTLKVPLTPDQWSDVNGRSGAQTPAVFENLLHHVGVVAMTFGGMFFGHGAWCPTGKADFRCHSYVIS